MSALQGRIAVIGWGSLIWDLDDIEPKVEGAWLMRAGPRLPFEFSRISPKRKYGLTLCLDPDHGEECPTHAILSRRDDIHQAAEDLRARERAQSIEEIGAFCARTGFTRSRIPEVTEIFSAWCDATGAAGAVWTDLARNFEEMGGGDFSLSTATAWLRRLTGESLEEAVRYIEFAPETTDTPLRRALAGDEWWRAEAEKLTRG